MNDVLRQIVLPRLENVRPSAGRFMARCPVHDDGTASLAISPGTTHPAVFTCHAGCDSSDVLAALGLNWSDVSMPRQDRAGGDDYMPCGWNGKVHDWRHRKVAEYLYRDQHGAVVFGVARCALKGSKDGSGRGLCQGFRQWRPDSTKKHGRTWSRTLPDGTKAGEDLIYRLPEVLAPGASPYVLIVEGEKDADRLWDLGLVATTNPQGGGAGKWTTAHARWLTGRDIIVVADRDNTGWAHAETVVNTLLDTARSIEVVRARTGNDISDHLDAGHDIADAVPVAVAKSAPHPVVAGA